MHGWARRAHSRCAEDRVTHMSATTHHGLARTTEITGLEQLLVVNEADTAPLAARPKPATHMLRFDEEGAFRDTLVEADRERF